MAEDEKRDLSDWDPSGETRCPVCKEKFLQHKLIAPHVIEKHPEEVNTAYLADEDLINEYKLALLKEREKSLRSQADYQNLEKQTVRILIFYFMTRDLFIFTK